VTAVPAGEGLPVSDDVEKYTTIGMALRQFPRLRYYYRDDMPRLIAAVHRRLQPAAQRSGRFLAEVFDAAELKQLLADLEEAAGRTSLPAVPRADRDEHITGDLRLLAQVNRDITQAGIDVLRRAGLTWSDIAKRLGYPSAASMRQTYRRIGSVLDPDEVLERSEQSLLEVHERFREVVNHPGYMHDVQGRLLRDPDGNPVLNEDVRIKGLLGQVKTVEVWDRLRGVIAPARTQITHDMAPLEARLLSAYDALTQQAVAEAEKRLAIEGVVISDVVEDKKPVRKRKPRRASGNGQERAGEGDEAALLSPSGSGVESPQQEQQNSGNQADQAES
jgi:hypothetical protein